jgi:hypothetical protein
MLNFDDPRWSQLSGGYRLPYDPRKALRSLEGDAEAGGAWRELWQELYHQGDVGEASYATVPHLARIQMRRAPDWNAYALAAVIEQARRAKHNPTIPPWLRDGYKAAWDQLVELGLRDFRTADAPKLVCAILSVLATFKDQTKLGRMALLTEDERTEMLDDVGWG